MEGPPDSCAVLVRALSVEPCLLLSIACLVLLFVVCLFGCVCHVPFVGDVCSMLGRGGGDKCQIH